MNLGEWHCIPQVHPQTHNPHTAWKEMKRRGRVSEKQRSLPLSTPVKADHVRFVCVSDTHGRMDAVMDKIPDGDVLIHAGGRLIV